MVKPGESHMSVFFVSFMLLLVCNQCRKIDFSEIKGINSQMPCQKYCRGVDQNAIWCCCGGNAKAMGICENRKTDCERKCVEAKAECCFDGY
uniref:Uncharacterized protein n=1 Tax=Tanacetum cinerariifolium TaxID=118510 RepID=A0A699Q043_TANCI|nr:hypothetical protein [Tanacetum cinerariifolium]